MNSLSSINCRNNKRDINIDFLKIIACIAVIGLHTLQKDLSTANALMHYFCGFAIPVFFFSTGYILLQRKALTFKYCLKKCLNIVRVVVIWNVGVNLCIMCLKILLGKGFDFISFLQDISYRPFIQKGRMWQFWYLGAMIILYLLLPLIHRAAYGDKKWKRFWGIFALTCVCIQAVSFCMNTPIQKNVIQTFRVWTWIQYFSIGGFCLFAHIIDKITVKQHIFILIIWSAINVVYQYLVGSFVLHNTYAEYVYDSFFEIVWIILIVSLVIRADLSVMGKYIEILSPLTMGVFIIHPLINTVCVHFITIDSVLISFAYFILITVLSFAATYILSKLPFSKYLLKI